MKTIFLYINFYISCVIATFKLRHLTYATGMEDSQHMRHLTYATGMEDSQYLRRSNNKDYTVEEPKFTVIYDNNY